MSKGFIGAWMIILIVVAIYIRVARADNYHYSDDEDMHIWIARANSLWDILKYSLYEVHPPFGHILRFYWVRMSDEIGFVRNLSLLFGIATISLYYLIGKLLKNEIAGMCCAALIAFGYGSIIQSYLARNYSIFMFFISATLYFYLLWRRDRRNIFLFFYTLSAIIASLTHFSAIFAVFPIAAYEAIRGYRNEELITQMKWIALNVFITGAAMAIYFTWVFHGVYLAGKFFETSSFLKLLLVIAINPVKATEYLLPSIYLLPLIVFLLFLPAVHEDRNLRQFLLLACIAFALGMVLLAANRYYPAGTRHGVWVLPFVIPACGWIIANGITESAAILNKKKSAPWLQVAMIFVIISGLAMYSPEKRFADSGEYQVTEKQWQEMSEYLDRLDQKSLIVDAIMVVDIYPYLDKATLDNKYKAIIIPYHQTHILFNPYYRRMITGDVLTNTLEYAQEHHMLDGIDNIVFMKTIWDTYYESKPPLPYLITCDALEKKITSSPPFSFPHLQEGEIMSQEEKQAAPVAFMSVSKKDFFEQVISPEGKAHHCLH